MLIISYKASSAIRKNSLIFSEFNLSKVLSLLVYTYPLAPILIMTNNETAILLLYSLVLIGYIVSLVISKKQSVVLSHAGTDRVNSAKDALSLVTLGASISIGYLFLMLVISFGVLSID